MPGIKKSKVAIEVPFDDTVAGLGADEVQTAIENVTALAANSSRGYVLAQYNGNANNGRFLDFFSGISSDDAPLYTDINLKIVTIVAATTGTDATCTIGFYNDTTLLHTLTFNNEKRVIENGATVFTLPADGELKIKIDTGSIIKPHLYFIVQGGA
jgi:hypothetical protein